MYFSFLFFFPLSFLFVGFPTFFCPIMQTDPKFGHQTLVFSLYLLSMPFHPLSLYQLPLLCRWFLEVRLNSFPLQSSRLKSPTTWWALPQYSKVSMSKTTLHIIFLKICFFHYPSTHIFFFYPNKSLWKAFHAQGTVLDFGNTMVSKTFSVDVIIILVWLPRPETMMSSLTFLNSKSNQSKSSVKFVLLNLYCILFIPTTTTLSLDWVSSINFSRSCLYSAICPWLPARCG